MGRRIGVTPILRILPLIAVLSMLSYSASPLGAPYKYVSYASYEIEERSVVDAIFLQGSNLTVAAYNRGLLEAYNHTKMLWRIDFNEGKRGGSITEISGLATVTGGEVLVFLSNKTIAVLDLSGEIRGFLYPLRSLGIRLDILNIDRIGDTSRALVVTAKGAFIVDLEALEIKWSYIPLNRMVYGGFLNGGEKILTVSIETFCQVCLNKLQKVIKVFDVSTGKLLANITVDWLVTATPVKDVIYAFYTRNITLYKLYDSGLKAFKAKPIDREIRRLALADDLPMFYEPDGGSLVVYIFNYSSLQYRRIGIPIHVLPTDGLFLRRAGNLLFLGIKRVTGGSFIHILDIESGELVGSIGLDSLSDFMVSGDARYILVEQRRSVYLYERFYEKAENKYRMEIVVTDEDGNLLDGVKVTIVELSLTNETSLNGSVAFTVPPSYYTVKFEREGFETYSMGVNLTTNRLLQVKLYVKRFTLEIRADEEGRPVNATAEVYREGELLYSGALRGGALRVDLPRGLYTIKCTYGMLSRQVEVNLTDNLVAECSFPGAKNYTIIIKGLPGEVGNVTLIITDPLSGRVLYRTEGAPEVTVTLYPGVYDVIVTVPGYGSTTRKVSFNESKSIEFLLQVSQAPRQLKFYMFGSPACPACRYLKEVITGNFGEDALVFRDITNSTNARIYQDIYDYFSLGSHYYIPLTIIYIGEDPKAVAVGAYPINVWNEILSMASAGEGILTVPENGTYRFVVSSEAVKRLNELVLGVGAGGKEERYTLGQVLPIVLVNALADSVNPCTFSIFTALLLITLSLSGRRNVLKVAVPFIGAIYLTYFAIGLGLIKIFSYIPAVKYAIGLLGIGFGSLFMISGWGGEFRSPVPARLKRITERVVERASKVVNPLTSAAAGFIISLTLLPCSSGPYLVATIALSKLGNWSTAWLLLAIYNLIFIAPLVAITVGVLLFAIKVRKLKIWRTKKLSLMETVSGILLIGIALYALLTL